MNEKTCCRKHWENSVVKDGSAYFRPFIVCATCGNKRCPKATDCELACTGSNESGQAGSIYAGGKA